MYSEIMSDTEVLNQILEELKKLNNKPIKNSIKKAVKKDVRKYTYDQIKLIYKIILEFYSDAFEVYFINSKDLLDVYNDFFIDNPSFINDKIANMSCKKMKHILQNEIPYCDDNREDTFIKYSVKWVNKITQRGYVINMEIFDMSYGLFKIYD